MKSIGEIMKELGFDPKGSPDVQRAFIKHMLNNIASNTPKTPEKLPTKSVEEPIQMSFDFDDSKKVS